MTSKNDEARFVARTIIDECGPIETPEDLEALAQDLATSQDAYEEGPEMARAVAAELRRRALLMRNLV